MPVTFQTPPSWPSPPAGFLPPQGWEPDPSWGPAPNGWVFYVDNGMPVAPPAGYWQPPSAGAAPTQPMPSAVPPPTMPSPSPAPMPSPSPSATYAAGPSYNQGPPTAPQRAAFGPPPGSPGMPAGMPPAPAPKKSKTGLIIGLAGGGLVLLIAVSLVLYLFVFASSGGPQLTTSQFSTVFAKGDTIMGSTIAVRTSFDPSGGSTDTACETAAAGIFRDGEEVFTAATSASSIIVLGVLFDDSKSADTAYSSAATACSSTESGTTNGAKWFTVDFADTAAQAVIVRYGNTGTFVMSTSYESAEDLASAVQEEISTAAK